MAPVALDYQPNQLASQQCFSLKKQPAVLSASQISPSEQASIVV
jgi:hypothetical protein